MYCKNHTQSLQYTREEGGFGIKCAYTELSICSAVQLFVLHGDIYSIPLCSLDIDECGRSLDNCEQNCSNTVGSFECSCQPGYQPVAGAPNRCEGRKSFDMSNPVTKLCAMLGVKLLSYYFKMLLWSLFRYQ